MSGLPTIFVDFSARDIDGRLYVARLSRFSPDVELGDRFIGTDHDEFDVECEVLAIDRINDRIYHRPVRAAEVPGTSAEAGLGTPSSAAPEPEPAAPSEPEFEDSKLVAGVA